MNRKRNYLIIIAGPTAVGKTALAISLARWLNSEIISADSRQIYRQMNIGTAKPSLDELSQIPHHFINELNIDQSFTAADFEQRALERLKSIFAKKSVAIMSGGSGLYINALCHGLDPIPDINIEVRERYDHLYQDKGLSHIQKLIRDRAPDYATIVDLENPRRIIRALSVIEVTGKPFSSFLNKKKTPRSFRSRRRTNDL